MYEKFVKFYNINFYIDKISNGSQELISKFNFDKIKLQFVSKI